LHVLRTAILIVAAIVVLCLCPQSVCAESCCGIIHIHSTFSDGANTIETLGQAFNDTNGAKFFVVCDHLDDIDLDSWDWVRRSFRPQLLNPFMGIEKRTGIEQYIDTCRRVTTSTGIVVVPGLEVELGGKADCTQDQQNPNNRVHMLLIGDITSTLYQTIKDKLRINCFDPPQKDMSIDMAQDVIAKLAHDAGLAVIIAHPYAEDPIRPGWYTMYKNKINSVDGVEFFQTDDNKCLEALGLINRDRLQGNFKPLVATSNCDFHGHFPTELTNLKHGTIINLEQPLNPNYPESSWKAIALAIKRGPTIAFTEKIAATNTSDQEYFQNGNFYLNDRFLSRDEANQQATNNDFLYIHKPGAAIISKARAVVLRENSILPPINSSQPDNGQNLTIPTPGGKLKVTLVSHEGVSTNKFGVIIGTREQIISANVTSDPIGKVWYIGPYQTGDALKFFIDSSYARERRYPKISTGSLATTWQLAFEDWTDNDINDLIIKVELVDGDSPPEENGNGTTLKYVRIINDSDYNIYVYVAWHNKDGWHNTDEDPYKIIYWEFKPGEKAILAEDDVKIEADKIRLWAETPDHNRSWRKDQKSDPIDLSQTEGDTYVHRFIN